MPIVGYRQVRGYTCGYASMLTVLRYYRPDTAARELYERLGTGRDGTRQSAIIRELRAAGLRAGVHYDFDFGRLRAAVDQDSLVVAYYYPAHHWIVLYGYGCAPDRVFVADSRADESCEHRWSSYGPKLRRFGIVVSPREQRPSAPESSPEQLAFGF